MDGARGVIINVTGGHDMSLMEVNEASLLIQEAAHEDANIIFGAVVDPTLDGRVKVTVIATGFEMASRPVPAPVSQTPVDLQQYTAHLKEKSEAPAMDLARMPISRRPSLDLASAPSAPPAVPVPVEVEATAADTGVDLEALSAFDVPAFLRREG